MTAPVGPANATPKPGSSSAPSPDPVLLKALLLALEHDPSLPAKGGARGAHHGAAAVTARQVARLQTMSAYPSYLLAAFTFDRSGEGQAVGQAAGEKSAPALAAACGFIPPAAVSPSVTASAIAGLMLRNHIRDHAGTMPGPVLGEVGTLVLPLLGSPEPLLRRTAATVLVALGEASVGALASLLPRLYPLLNSVSAPEREAALAVCAKLVEDVPGRMEDVRVEAASSPAGSDTVTARPLDALVPGWIRAMGSSDVSVRVLALRSLIPLADALSAAFEKHETHFLAALFALTDDAHAAVRKLVCQAFCTLWCNYTDTLAPHLPAVIDYMLARTRDTDHAVALEACRFWLDAAEDADLARDIRPALPRLVPVLLACMVYDQADLAVLEQEQAKCTATAAASGAAPASAAAPGDGGTAPPGAGGKEPGETDDDDQDDDEAELLGGWNLRKCSAASLDALSVRFGSELLKPLLPLLKTRLYSPDWVQREVAILALGAVAEGAYEGMRLRMGAVIPYLLKSLDDPHVVVRSIACWSLGRYVRCCVGDESPAHLNKYLVPVIDGLLRTTLDPSKRLHEGACSALATLEEEAGPALVPYVHKIMVGLMQAFKASHGRGLLNVYDALTVLVDSAGAEVCKRGEAHVILEPLMGWWCVLGNDDEARLVPLLECLTSIAIAFGQDFLPYAPAVFQRCVVLVADIMGRYDTRLAAFPSEDARVLVMDCFDLLSGIMQGLQAGAAPLVAAMAASALPLLTLCLRVPDGGVRQSALAFLGDTAMYAFASLAPCLGPLLPHLVAQIDEDPEKDELSVCNNATWAAGEVALQLGPVADLRAHVPDLVARLTRVLLSPKSNESLTENAAVALGRLGLVFPQAVAPHLPAFAERWCASLWDVKDSDEKDSAFLGLCAMVATRPAAIDAAFPFAALAITRWRTPSHALNSAFAALLTAHKARLGPDLWQSTVQSLPAPIAKRLVKRYNL